jgi:hypothetical protein
MARFRKRPIEVDAEQWRPGTHMPGVAFEAVESDKPSDALNFAVRAYVTTIHGQRAYLDPGDWVIAEPVAGRFYPCKPDEFARIYEPADNPNHFQPSLPPRSV